MPRSALAPLALLLLCIPGIAVPPSKLDVTSKDQTIELRGSGSNPWELRFGKAGSASNPDEFHLAEASPERAFFSHGPWLRLIDTKSGIVIGRWFMPGIISKIDSHSPNSAEIEIKNTVEKRDFRRSFAFDVDHPVVPAGENESLLAERVSQSEVYRLLPPTFDYRISLPQADARALLPLLQELSHGDPLSPWPRLALGKVMRDAGVDGALTKFQEAIALGTTFPELFQVSAFLENLRVPSLADDAFERGYRIYIRSGHDPRLATSIISRLVIYPLTPSKISPERRNAVIEHIYMLGPDAEGTELAWGFFARTAQTPAERTLWRSRAAEAANGTHIFSAEVHVMDIALLVIVAFAMAKFVFLASCCVLYQPQRRFDKQAKRLQRWQRVAFANIQYWSISQRAGVILVLILVWFTAGLMKQSTEVVLTDAKIPISATFGDYSGPSSEWFFSNYLASSPERTFLIALSKQQSGDTREAARLYQQVPQFPEAWNNLGVIWKTTGRSDEAAKAFQRALQMKPGLHEARLNLGNPDGDVWTRIHQQYAPDLPMLAVPDRNIFSSAFLGRPYHERFKWAFIDAWRPWHLNLLANDDYTTQDLRRTGSFALGIAELGIVVIVLVLVFPRLPVEQPPSRAGSMIAALVPGSARAWRVLGPPIVLAWMFLIMQLFLLKRFGSPYILSYIATPNLARAYGAEEFSPSLINPRPIWVYGLPALLFVVNLIVVFGGMRRTGAANQIETSAAST